jgi:hypothetical protein
MARIGTLGRNFLEGTPGSDRILGDASTLSSRTAGGDQLHGYGGADFLYGDVTTLGGSARG